MKQNTIIDSFDQKKGFITGLEVESHEGDCTGKDQAVLNTKRTTIS